MYFHALLPVVSVAAAPVNCNTARALKLWDHAVPHTFAKVYRSAAGDFHNARFPWWAVLPTVKDLIGLGCTPITVIGVGSGASCTAQSVCCTNNNFNGMVNLECTPINLSLESAKRREATRVVT